VEPGIAKSGVVKRSGAKQAKRIVAQRSLAKCSAVQRSVAKQAKQSALQSCKAQ